MWTAMLKWLFGTAMGRGVLLGGSITIGLAGGWFLFSSHYDNAGYQRCKGEQASALAEANAERARNNIEAGKTAGTIGRETSDAVSNIVKDANNNTTTDKETVDEIYRQPPKTAPVAIGSCVHPVDDRVQERIDRSVSRSNGRS